MNIFLSYSHTCKIFADFLVKKFSEKHIKLIRDINDLDKLESIEKFTELVSETDYIIMIVNENYIRSINCMYEMSEVLKERNYKKIIPIIDEKLNIYDIDKRIHYITYWSEKLKSTQEKANKILGININKINYKIELIEKITKNIDEFLNMISDNSSITYSDDLLEKTFSQITKVIFNRVFDNEMRNNMSVKRNKNIILPDEFFLCIDFGTSYTLASVVDIHSKIHLIPDILNKSTIPSVISLLNDGSYTVGNSALCNDMRNDSILIKNIKRMVGLKEYYYYDNKKISVQMIISLLINSIKRNAEEFLGTKVYGVLLSVPVEYSVREIQIIKESVQLTGVWIQRIIQESSIAPIIYSMMDENCNNDLIINIDLGGGTFDLAIVEVTDGVYDVEHLFGDKNLGSIDYDYIICEYVIKEIQKKYYLNYVITEDTILYKKILYESEKVKTRLNKEEYIDLCIYSDDHDTGNIMCYEITITKEIFKELTKSLNKKIENILLKVRDYIEGYPYKKWRPELKYILLTGQGTKLFIVRELIENIFKSTKIIDKYQENAVINGLAVEAGILSGVIKDIIMLNLNNSEIDIFCSKIQSRNVLKGDKFDLIYFSQNDNKEVYTLIGRETIPYVKEVLFKFEDNFNETYEIILMQTSLNERNRTPIKSILLEPHKGITYKMVLDIDANNCIKLSIYDDSEKLIIANDILIY